MDTVTLTKTEVDLLLRDLRTLADNAYHEFDRLDLDDSCPPVEAARHAGEARGLYAAHQKLVDLFHNHGWDWPEA